MSVIISELGQRIFDRGFEKIPKRKLNRMMKEAVTLVKQEKENIKKAKAEKQDDSPSSLSE